MPLLKHFLRKRITIGIAFGIKPGTGIAVVVPGTAKIAVGLQHGGMHTQVGKALDLVDSGHARADDDGFVVRYLCARHWRLLLGCTFGLGTLRFYGVAPIKGLCEL